MGSPVLLFSRLVENHIGGSMGVGNLTDCGGPSNGGHCHSFIFMHGHYTIEVKRILSIAIWNYGNGCVVRAKLI